MNTSYNYLITHFMRDVPFKYHYFINDSESYLKMLCNYLFDGSPKQTLSLMVNWLPKNHCVSDSVQKLNRGILWGKQKSCLVSAELWLETDVGSQFLALLCSLVSHHTKTTSCETYIDINFCQIYQPDQGFHWSLMSQRYLVHVLHVIYFLSVDELCCV